mmetsp:Transcript_27180/g.63240  ORF Transcript_27180/g.63240 Transcript_27180/m.63240 type:complete len:606 (-) Transcript_27180:55-1872(-)|eukprot:CAMPEP_0178407914 /NCGR_PEP_ID=MMETSP0689_2-20121128/19670_1 /TAXON_ID=160604 /ORGANISM="Amphidinium massartii, Strain CS-259" /LENGTH=605 /DNA_ID=CAMNT_0020028995 /DNA_START=92 /DNA_END=1909 /DNA_ORIENTATION=-
MAAAAGAPQFASLYVGDLHPDVTEAVLYEIFNAVGHVASIRICRDAVSRRSLGYAYVNFHKVEDAERALDTLNYSSIKGRSCRIMWSQRDPTLRKTGAGNIYVKNLDSSIDNKALYDTFSLFGNILSCKVASDATGKSHGYGFVHYESEEAAKQAIEKVNGMMIGEKTVQVTMFVKRTERSPADLENYTNLYVKNIPKDHDEAKVRELFGEYGEITSMALRSNNQGLPFAFVNFAEVESAKKCVEALHGKDMRSEEEIAKDKEEGKEPETDPISGLAANQLYVQRAQTKAERQKELREKFGADGGKSQGVNLYVKNLDESMDDTQLRQLFEPFGPITSVATPKDEKGNCKGFGFVCFSSPEDATKAVTDMHLKVIKGKPLYVGLAERREAREERLRQRYAKGAGGGKGAAPFPPQNPMQGMPGKGMMRPPGGMMMPPMMGGGGMCGAPMGMMPHMAMMGPRGPMVGGPQMMAMMGKGGPQMMGKGGPQGPPMGMMRPPMQQMPKQMPCPMPPRPHGPAQGAPPAGPPDSGNLTAAQLAAMPPAQCKQMLGERLYPQIAKFQPELAGKITGMMLEMDASELLILLESEQQLKSKVDEALAVLGTQG